jgi:hypothetical protein
MRSLTLAALRHRTPGHRTPGHRIRSAADQRLLDVALAMSRQGIRPAPVRRG